MGRTGRSEDGTSGMDNGIECSLSKFADNNMLCEAVEAVDILEGRDVVQTDLT